MANVLGIVAEYNPFHNGHLYHIENAKSKTNCDYVVAIISGNFTQRGDTSIVNKWEKAKMALNNGVDLVIELPTIYSISSAENFAYGAIKILNELGIVNYISFGMEQDDLTILDNIANVLYNEPKDYQDLLKKELKNGVTYAKGIENALCKFLKDDNYKNILNGSNNILAIEYLKSLKRMKSKIIPIGIKREKVFYNSRKIADEYASATGIRYLLEQRQIKEVSKLVPNSSFNTLIDNIQNGQCNINIFNFSKEIMYKLRSMSVRDISNLPEVSEGLEYLIKESSEKTNSLLDVINNIKSKRYTQTRIQRILLYALLGINKSDMEMSKKIKPYVRILGFNDNGKKLLSKISNKTKVITSVKDFENNNKNIRLKRMLDIDKYATDIYTLGYSNNSISNLDYTNGLIIIK